MDRKIIIGQDARQGMVDGVNALANLVKVTLGPKGRIVFMYDKYAGVHGTKDGVTVAENVFLEDEHQKMGALAVLQVASNTADLAGDGTTTATVLAQKLLKEGIKNITSGANPIDLKRGMDKGLKEIIKHLDSIKIDIGDDNEKIKNVASISANNDEELGELIASAYAKIGNQGKITVEESQSVETYVDVVGGLQFPKGYFSPYFSTNIDAKEIVYDDCYLLLSSDKVTSVTDVQPVVDFSIKNNKPICLMVPEISEDALAYMVMAKLRQNSKAFAVKAPYYGIKRNGSLEDSAVLTGGYVISASKGYKISDFEDKMLGFVNKAIVTSNSAIFVNGAGKQASIDSHVKLLKQQKENKDFTGDRGLLEHRIAALTSGVAVLYVGAASEVEMKEKKDRIDDALSATKSAIEEGIVPGGGVALVRASKSIEFDTIKLEGDEKTGVKIVLEACKEPLLQIARNAGESGEVILNKIIESDEINYGYDFKKDVYGDLMQFGIIDPKKVSRVALENAVSVAGMIMMTEGVLVNLENQGEGLPEYL